MTRQRDMVTEATTEMASLKKVLSEGEHKVPLELKEPKKQEARVGEVQEELQELGKKFESLERDLKTKESELAKALASMKDAKAEAEMPSRKSRRPRR